MEGTADEDKKNMLIKIIVSYFQNTHGHDHNIAMMSIVFSGQAQMW